MVAETPRTSSLASILTPIGVNVKSNGHDLGFVPTSALALVPKTKIGTRVTENWEAVGRAISARLTELRVTQLDVAARANVSLTTLRELQRHTNSRRRRPQTLSAISEALGWAPGHLAAVLHGEDIRPPAEEIADPVMAALTSIERELEDLRARVDQIERRLAGEGA